MLKGSPKLFPCLEVNDDGSYCIATIVMTRKYIIKAELKHNTIKVFQLQSSCGIMYNITLIHPQLTTQVHTILDSIFINIGKNILLCSLFLPPFLSFSLTSFLNFSSSRCGELDLLLTFYVSLGLFPCWSNRLTIMQIREDCWMSGFKVQIVM